MKLKLEPLMDSTILVVEHEEDMLQANEDYINQIEKVKKESAGINKFIIDKAISIEVALEKLSQRIKSPYSMVLLDMSFPDATTRRSESGNYVTQGTREKEFRGYEVLDFVRTAGAADAVIVVSAYTENLPEVFRRGASDFIIKPRSTEELQGRVLTCWSRLLLNKSQQVLGERISDLVPYAEKGLAHRFSTCFSSLVRTVAHTSEDMERYMRERYGLDRRKDSEDFFFTCLNSEEDSITTAKREWAALKAPLQSADESSRAAKVETLLQDIHQSLLPCLTVKNVTLDFLDEGAPEILTFEDDVQVILKEIIVGAASKLPDFNEAKKVIAIKVESADGQVKVRCTDDLEPIAPELAKSVNEGSTISPVLRFGREWGLSVVQHIAMRGGGRLEIDPQADGNIVTYFIPSAG
jgi:CheY-like chemotaxis protein